jgi:hypothetical protein
MVDEISAISSLLLHCFIKNMKQLFRTHLPFAGKTLILVGDLFQLPPAGGKNNSFVDAVAKVFIDQSRHTSDAEKFVADIMVHSTISNLVLNERAKDDPWLADLIARIRTSDPIAFPIRDILLPVIEQFVLNQKDVSDCSNWTTAPILATGNRERASIISTRALAVAKKLGVPLIRWRLALNAKSSSTLSTSQITELYENEPRAWGYYIQGYPGYVRKNVNVGRGVSNGTLITYHSLTLSEVKEAPLIPVRGDEYDDDDGNDCGHFGHGYGYANVETDAKRLAQAKAGDDIVLKQPPLSINAMLENRSADEFTDCTVVPGFPVIPLLAQTEYVKCYVPGQGQVTLSFKDINCDLALSATFYKAQGRNMPLILGCLSKNPCPLLRLTFSSVFVWLSRTRTAATCKALPLLKGETWDSLSSLRASENLIGYLNGFSDNEPWNAVRAREARAQHRLAGGSKVESGAVRSGSSSAKKTVSNTFTRARFLLP